MIAQWWFGGVTALPANHELPSLPAIEKSPDGLIFSNRIIAQSTPLLNLPKRG
jgi:hypothetical protein